MLNQTKFLIVDCQTTGLHVEGNHILEIAWAIWDSKNRNIVTESFILRLPQDASIPKYILRMTGVTEKQLSTGFDPREVCMLLTNALSSLNEETPVVISHSAQFELKFLKEFFKQYCPYDKFSFEMICTQKIIKRLLPNLPSTTLTGVAGYYGITIPKVNRAPSHVEVTSAIWNHIVDQLILNNIHTYKQLVKWSQQINNVAKKEYEYHIEKFKRLDLPTQPGVYKMLNTDGAILYIGKLPP